MIKRKTKQQQVIGPAKCGNMKIFEVAQFRNFEEPEILWQRIFKEQGTVEETLQVLEAYMVQKENQEKLSLSESLVTQEVASFEGNKPQIGTLYYGFGISAIGENVKIVANFRGLLKAIEGNQFIIQYKDGTTGKYPDLYFGDMVVNTLLFEEQSDYQELLSFIILKYDVKVPKLEESASEDEDSLSLPDIEVGDKIRVECLVR